MDVLTLEAKALLVLLGWVAQAREYVPLPDEAKPALAVLIGINDALEPEGKGEGQKNLALL